MQLSAGLTALLQFALELHGRIPFGAAQERRALYLARIGSAGAGAQLVERRQRRERMCGRR